MARYRIQGVTPDSISEHSTWPAAKRAFEVATYQAIRGLAGLDTRWGRAMHAQAASATKPDHVGGGCIVARTDGHKVILERIA